MSAHSLSPSTRVTPRSRRGFERDDDALERFAQRRVVGGGQREPERIETLDLEPDAPDLGGALDRLEARFDPRRPAELGARLARPDPDPREPGGRRQDLEVNGVDEVRGRLRQRAVAVLEL